MAAMVKKKNSPDIFMLLPILAICVDLFTPYPIWKNILPSEIRWLSHAALAAILFLSLVRMLGYNLIPLSFWVSMFITALWSAVALVHGQGIVPTIWGTWLLFQFPFVAIFMYLQREPPSRFPEYLRTFCLAFIVIEVAAQLVQYATGTTPGDDLSGLFGRHGTHNAVLSEILVCCIFFGYWITNRRWTGIAIALPLSMLSSVLGEMKLFILAIAVISLIAVILYIVKYPAPGKTILYLGMIVLILVSFFVLYNTIIPDAQSTPLQTYITNPAKLLDYLMISEDRIYNGINYTEMGRIYRVQVGWSSLQRDPVTFLFGYGIGTRSESQTLGTAGVALLSGSEGLSVGSSLLVIMQEMGIVGLLLFTGFLGWISLTLIRDIQAFPESPATGLRYGLLIFSILWPLWLFYSTSWLIRVPMLLYWFSFGYVLAEARILKLQPKTNLIK